ncbi:MAG: hypothetical protein AXW13_03010 [Alcanivorax sp. Nap_24]|nr:MAG: hypothetical protein AXW13_03010 [Alcanivorax sp. Nap_24]
MFQCTLHQGFIPYFITKMIKLHLYRLILATIRAQFGFQHVVLKPQACTISRRLQSHHSFPRLKQQFHLRRHQMASDMATHWCPPVEQAQPQHQFQ